MLRSNVYTVLVLAFDTAQQYHHRHRHPMWWTGTYLVTSIAKVRQHLQQ
jgi:hypothetical protein